VFQKDELYEKYSDILSKASSIKLQDERLTRSARNAFIIVNDSYDTQTDRLPGKT
jgi:hypothetical protein